MKIINKRLVVLFLSTILLVNTLVVSNGLAVATNQDLVAKSSTPAYEYILDTDGIDVGEVYAIIYKIGDLNRLLFCDSTMTDVLSVEINNNKLTLIDWFDSKTQLWEVVSTKDGEKALKSKYSNRYLDLSKYSDNNVYTSPSAIKLTIGNGKTDNTHTIQADNGGTDSYWLGYNIKSRKFSSTTQDQSIDVLFYKQTEITKSAEYVRETRDITSGSIYAIGFQLPDGTYNLLGSNGNVTAAIPATVNGDKLKMHDWIDPSTQLWQVVSLGNGDQALKSMSSGRTYYLNLHAPVSTLKAHNGTKPSAVVINKNDGSDTYTIKDKVFNTWLSYHNKWNEFSTEIGKGVNLVFFKQVYS